MKFIKKYGDYVVLTLCLVNIGVCIYKDNAPFAAVMGFYACSKLWDIAEKKKDEKPV